MPWWVGKFLAKISFCLIHWLVYSLPYKFQIYLYSLHRILWKFTRLYLEKIQVTHRTGDLGKGRYLENLVYHFFGQLWLVLGVK